jgi:hypothetical protein
LGKHKDATEYGREGNKPANRAITPKERISRSLHPS